jgi:hypothetical protein
VLARITAVLKKPFARPPGLAGSIQNLRQRSTDQAARADVLFNSGGTWKDVFTAAQLRGSAKDMRQTLDLLERGEFVFPSRVLRQLEGRSAEIETGLEKLKPPSR